MPRGGKRPGSGRPPGAKNVATITKEEAREGIRRAIARHADALVEAQIANARGISYLVTRDKKSGKFIRVTKAMAEQKLGSEEFEVEVWEKDPSVQAFTDLLNRYVDKPKEQEQEVKVDAEVTFKWQS